MKDPVQTIIRKRKQLFWDKGPMDPEEDKFVIVERILEFGTESEFHAIIRRYGEGFIREVIRKSPNLSPKTVNYFAWLLDIPRELTRCFSNVSLRIWQPF